MIQYYGQVLKNWKWRTFLFLTWYNASTSPATGASTAIILQRPKDSNYGPNFRKKTHLLFHNLSGKRVHVPFAIQPIIYYHCNTWKYIKNHEINHRHSHYLARWPTSSTVLHSALCSAAPTLSNTASHVSSQQLDIEVDGTTSQKMRGSYSSSRGIQGKFLLPPAPPPFISCVHPCLCFGFICFLFLFPKQEKCNLFLLD